MARKALQKSVISSVPPDAMQVQHYASGQFCYVLPRNESRLFPINVFVGTDMRRSSVDLWYTWTATTTTNCTDPILFMLHDMRNCKVHYTPYSFKKIGELRAVRPDLSGYSAVIYASQETIFPTIMKGLVQNRPT